MTTPTVPQVALPVRIDPATGGLALVDQDSIDDIANCVTAILGTPQGTRWDLPDLGIVDPLFDVGLDASEVQGQLAKYEPRAQTAVTAAVDPSDELAVAVNVRVQTLRATVGGVPQ